MSTMTEPTPEEIETRMEETGEPYGRARAMLRKATEQDDDDESA